MKYPLVIIISLSTFLPRLTACEKDALKPSNSATYNTDGNPNQTGSQLLIKIGTITFTATLLDNATAAAFKTRLPMTITMRELNGNEKYFDLPTSLPANALNPGTIQNGDLMLYGSNTLVLFYKGFSTPYSYTKLGRINDPVGLAAAVGPGNETITFELQ